MSDNMCYAAERVNSYQRGSSEGREKLNKSSNKAEEVCVKRMSSSPINEIIYKSWKQYVIGALNSKSFEIKELVLQKSNIDKNEYCSQLKQTLNSFSELYNNFQRENCVYEDHIDTGSVELDVKFKEWVDVKNSFQNLLENECL